MSYVVEDPQLSTTLIGYLMFSRGLGNILSTPIATALSRSNSDTISSLHERLGFDVGGGKYERVIVYVGTCFAGAAIIALVAWGIEKARLRPSRGIWLDTGCLKGRMPRCLRLSLCRKFDRTNRQKTFITRCNWIFEPFTCRNTRARLSEGWRSEVGAVKLRLAHIQVQTIFIAMGDSNFFKGTSTDQDRRFSDKESKLLKTLKFPKEFDQKVWRIVMNSALCYDA